MPNFDASFKIGLDEAIALLENLEATLTANLAAMGITEPQRPVFQTAGGPAYCSGELPPNLTSMTDTELGDKLGELSAVMNYWGDQLALADNKNSIVKQQLEDVSSHLRLLYTTDAEGKKNTDQQRKDLMRCDRRFAQANARATYYQAFYTIIKAAHTKAEQSYAAVSRRITQRGQDVERDRRGATVGAFQGPPVFRRPGM